MSLIGKTVSHYQILDKIGSGGMGVVYRARDTKLDRLVALKFLSPNLSHDDEAKNRFMHEAKAASALDHPNICSIYEIDETEDGQMFIVMACYEGESLKDKITDQGLKIKEAIDYAMQIAQGVAKAHEKEIIHRDIKPANILITKEGVVKIVDFGLAKLVGKTMLTKEGTTIGTVAYMSPEQTQGKKVDQRTDIWALGVIVYEMLTGVQPFKGDYDQAVVYSIMNEQPMPLTEINSGIPQFLEQIVNKALEKDPGKRYQHMGELLEDLESLSTGMVPEKIRARFRKVKHRRMKKIIITGLPITGILIILGLFIIPRIFNYGEEPEKSIVVCPFNYLSDEPDKQYLADGVMEAILLNLSKIKDLRIVSRTSVEQYRKTDKTVSTICRELNVAYLLEGSFQKYGDTAKLIVQLIKPGKERHVWANEYNRNWKEIFSVQSEVAQTVARELHVVIAPEEKQRIENIPTTNMTAYDAYLKGAYYWRKITSNDLDTALQYFELAKEKDSEFALAYTGIGFVWLVRQQMGYASPDEAGPKAMAGIMRALELDSTIAEIHYALALINFYGMWDWKEGESAFKKVFAINSNHAEAHGLYSHLLNITGRPEEAMEHIKQALKLDPHNPLIKVWYSQDLLYMRRYDDCISVSREVLEKNPAMVVALDALYQALHLAGRYGEAFEAIRFFFTTNYKDFNHIFDQYAKLGYTGTLNLEGDTLIVQSKTKYILPVDIGLLYLIAGNKERALECLEQAFEIHDPTIPYITRPTYDSLRDDPRFQDLCRKINIPCGR